MNPLRPARQATAVLVLATLTLCATGCADSPNDTEGGMGLPAVSWLPEPVDGDTEIAGTMFVAENGCFHLDTNEGRLFALWPDGFEADGGQVLAADGSPIADGDELSGSGVVLDADAAIEAGGGRDSQLAQAILYCAEGADVAVLHSVTLP